MRSYFYRLLFVITLLVSWGLVWSNTPYKSARFSKEHPFYGKVHRYLGVSGAASEKRAFEAEVKQLSRRMATKVQALRHAHGEVRVRQSESLIRLARISQGSLEVHWNEAHTRPIFIRGSRLQEKTLFKPGELTDANLQRQALAFLQENRELFQIEDPEREFKLLDIQRDRHGLIHLRYQQSYRDLEVWGRDVRVHINQASLVESFNGRYIATPRFLSGSRFSVSERNAKAVALQAFSQPADEIRARQLIFVDEHERPHLAWLVRIEKGLADNWVYFIDGESGEILRRYNHVLSDGPVTGSGVDLFDETRSINAFEIGGTFFMIDASKPMFDEAASMFPQDGRGVIYTLDARNADSTLFFVTSDDVNDWSDKSSVSAAANGALVFDFYLEKFDRNAIDGNGSTMFLVVNFNENFNNAFWNGQLMVFGNGDGTTFSDLAGSLDVTAHEMTHGVIERTANLIYQNQPGALNESFADVFGALFEFWVEGENGDWLIGEDVTTPAIAGDALRDMEDPASDNVAFGKQPTRLSEFVDLPNTPDGDNGGVHVNSGIPNRAFFLFANDPAVGIEMAGEVYFQALTQYLTRNSQFIDCRLAIIKAVDDVFGAGTSEAEAAKTAAANAFDTVEIFDDEGTPPPETLPPVEGEEFLTFIDTGSGLLFRVSLTNQAEPIQISQSPVSSRPTVTDDGSFILYVDDTHNVHLLASDGSSDEQLSTSGVFSNLAISPNGRFLAVTANVALPSIFILDLQAPSDEEGVQEIELYTPTTAEGTTTGEVLFPDRIDWDSKSEVVMYDAFNTLVNASGDTIGYWDINLLRPAEEAITRLFPPQPPGIDIGNPVFASNSDNIIAFDFVDENGDVTVKAVKLNTFEEGSVVLNANSLGSPTFSNDDSKVFYHRIESGESSIRVVDLLEDGITGAGNDQTIISNGLFPVAFAVGERPTGVEEPEEAVPNKFVLHQNYPNPFNPETTIRYELPKDAEISLKIFDITGRLVTELETGFKSAGVHTVSWNGQDSSGNPAASGIYFYRLAVLSGDRIVNTLTNRMTILK